MRFFHNKKKKLNCWTRKEMAIIKIDDSNKIHNSLFLSLSFNHSRSSSRFRSFFFDFSSHSFFFSLLILSYYYYHPWYELTEHYDEHAAKYVFVPISHDDFIFIFVREWKYEWWFFCHSLLPTSEGKKNCFCARA